MPKQRNPENQGLPKRWRFTRNAYYYQVPPGQEFNWEGKQTFKLGNTLPALQLLIHLYHQIFSYSFYRDIDKYARVQWL